MTEKIALLSLDKNDYESLDQVQRGDQELVRACNQILQVLIHKQVLSSNHGHQATDLQGKAWNKSTYSRAQF